LSRRGRRLTVAIAALFALLFVGRWIATLLADRWWGAQFSPAAAQFLTDWHLLRFTLDLTGCLVASAWFIGHLLLVYRAVGTVQVRRNVANLEFREALTPRALLTVVVVSGVLLGLLVGAGTSGWWRNVVLAWQGVAYGVSDPLLGRDVGLYVAQLPIWRAAHGFLVLLILLALSGVAALYMLVGAIRWIERRPAINHHARAHLGWLLAGLALALAWGYLLERYELVGGPAELLDKAQWQATYLASPVLTGMALAAAVLSAVWAARPRHALFLGAWIVLASASLAGHWILPAMMGGSADPAVTVSALERLGRVGYRLDDLRDTRLEPIAPPAPPAVPSLWNPTILAEVVRGDSTHLPWVNPAVLTPESRRRPAWLVVQANPSRVLATAVADHRVSPTGQPLFYRLSDSLPRPTAAPLLDYRPEVLTPDGGDYRVGVGDGPGVPVDSWLRRVLLAWALQAGELLGDLPPHSRIDWRLSPQERLGRLAPYADWSAPVARIIDGELVWLSDGYLTSATFPLTHRVTWRGRKVGSVDAAFLGTVEAESGDARVYLQPGAGPLGTAWSHASGGVVEPTTAIPESVLRAAPYPGDLFRAQVPQLERAPWKAGTLSGSPTQGVFESPPPQTSWTPDSSGPVLVSTYESPGERRLSAVVTGLRNEGRNYLTLVRLDSAATLPIRTVLEERWAKFQTYDALSDSIREDGGKLVKGPVKVEIGPGGPVAYQAYFAHRHSGGVVLVWVSVAAPNRMGAGRTLKDAWSNLLGATVPAPPGSAQAGRLDEASRLMQEADSALRAGDWPRFGRAWSGLRNLLRLPADSTRF
jgi:uncharacterized protein